MLCRWDVCIVLADVQALQDGPAEQLARRPWLLVDVQQGRALQGVKEQPHYQGILRETLLATRRAAALRSHGHQYGHRRRRLDPDNVR
jgi:hypothetical protein